MSKKRLAERYNRKCVIIMCADCKKVKKHQTWVNITEEDWKKLNTRGVQIILDTCGCFTEKSLNDWKGGEK